MLPSGAGRGAIEDRATLNGVAQDKSDKLGGTWAVVFNGDLLPGRFAGKREAFSHLRQLCGGEPLPIREAS